MTVKNVGTLSIDIDGYRALVSGDMVVSVSLGKPGLGIKTTNPTAEFVIENKVFGKNLKLVKKAVEIFNAKGVAHIPEPKDLVMTFYTRKGELPNVLALAGVKNPFPFFAITEAVGEKTSLTFGASGKLGAFVGFETEAMRGDYVVAILKRLGDVARKVVKKQIDLTPVLKKYVKMDDKLTVVALFTEAKKNLLLLDTKEKVVLANSINKGIGETGVYAKVGGNKLQKIPFVEPDVQKVLSSL